MYQIAYTIEGAIDRLKEIKNDAKAIRESSTWLLGIIVIIILALANFIANNTGIEAGETSLVISLIARTTCFLYLAILLFYIPLLIIPKFGNPIHLPYEVDEMQNVVNENAQILERLNKHFQTLVNLFIALPLTALAVIGIAYLIA